MRIKKIKKILYNSSTCIYHAHNQEDSNNPICSEDSAYPANPDSEYGWEKLFSERMFLAFNRNNKIPVAIARYHNIYGPEGTWDGGKEKAPAAICRKVIMTPENGDVEIWGDGEQTRSFLYIDECIEATRRLMESDFTGPVNIGSEEMVTINQLVRIACDVEGKDLKITGTGKAMEISFAYEKKIPLFGSVSLLIDYRGGSTHAVPEKASN